MQFSAPGYVSSGDPFQDAAKTMLKMRNADPQGHIKAGHDKAFCPAKVVKQPVKAAYDHKTDLDDKKKNFRNEDGEVVIGPRNFLTNPLKVG